MTDYTKLIERLRELQGVIAKGGITRLPDSETVREAEDAIKAQANQIDALAGELNDMKDWKDFMRDKMDVQLHQQWIQKIMARLADLLDEDQFAEIEAMALRAGAALQSAIEALAAERDQLQARLDAMGKGEPVAYLDLTKLQVGGMAYATSFKTTASQTALYAAPKALAPLTDDQIYKVFASTVKEAEPFSELVGDPIWAEVVEITRAIESAHGIGGTP